jgi:hypothetical protein
MNIEGYPPRDGLKRERSRQNEVTHERSLEWRRILQAGDSFVERYARPQCKHQKCDDEAPEVELTAVTEWMTQVGRLTSAFHPVKDEQLVDGVPTECTPSLSMAELPMKAAATNLIAAIARLATRAA